MKRIAGVAIGGAFALAVAGLILGVGIAGADVAGHFAGYSAPSSTAPTQTATATFKVPKANCRHVPFFVTQLVSIGVLLEVSGGADSSAAFIVRCPTPQFADSILEVGGNNLYVAGSLTINPGDLVTATASESTAASSVTLTDGSQTQTVTGTGGTVTGIDIGVFNGSCLTGVGCLPVPKVSTTKFTGVAINGSSLTVAGAVQATMTDHAGHTEMVSTAVTKKGTAFKVKWVMTCQFGPLDLC